MDSPQRWSEFLDHDTSEQLHNGICTANLRDISNAWSAKISVITFRARNGCRTAVVSP